MRSGHSHIAIDAMAPMLNPAQCRAPALRSYRAGR